MSNQLHQLWVKEDVPNPSYVDLFDRLRTTSIFHENVLEQVIDVRKDDALSEQYRLCGNEFIGRSNFKSAIEQYNKSVCFAENGTVVSFAFANRAYCFLELELYDECLTDIELAVKASYPKKLMPKLEQRKIICLMRMNTSIEPAPIEPVQLSFDAHDELRYMANVLAVKQNEEFGRHLMAKCDIQEDEVVMVEKPLLKFVDDNSTYKRCYFCLKRYKSMIPCGLCTKALFRRACFSIVDLHKYECNLQHLKFFAGRTGNVGANCVKFVIRVIASVLEVFSSSDELMDYIELLRKGHDADAVIVTNGSVEALLGIFLTHHHLIPYESGQVKVLILSCIAYDFIMHMELKTNFLTQKIQRFLMHLVTHLVSMFVANNVLLENWSEESTDIIDHNSTETFGVGLFNISSHINHACLPNVVRLTTTSHVVVKTLRPIQKGEQIFVRYAIDPHWSTQQRQQQLFNICGFICKCQLCQSDGPLSVEVSAISMELADLTVELSPLIFLRVKEAHKWTALKAKLFEFIKKHEHLPVSKSIILSYEYTKMILMRELSCFDQGRSVFPV